ncbi:amidohydrolase family protein [Ramlibacter sp.]|uniref:amidohydrolase family protein n=1 Tax=Ramlibacter sp. TaxID=1917967 RepID=UPI003D14C684
MSHPLPKGKEWDFRQSLAVLDARFARQPAEEILMPELRIIDPHHHLVGRPHDVYLLEDFVRDLDTGHDIVATMFVECSAMWKKDGPEELRPVGETEFANGIAAMAASGHYGKTLVNHGIVSYADLRLGDKVYAVLDAHIAAGNGRLRGIRNRAFFEPLVGEYGSLAPGDGLMRGAEFRKGLKRVAAKGLVYDSCQYHVQLPDFTDLARAVPEATLVLDHVSSPLGVAHYASRKEEVFAHWTKWMRELSTCPNVYVKLGGLGMPFAGLGLNNRELPATSAELAAAWKPFFWTAIEFFGANRCMFESNFPPDKQSGSYPVVMNAYKRIAAGASKSEVQSLFFDTANAVYRLGL